MQIHSTGIRNLSGSAYKALPIPVPPLDEQQRIVSGGASVTLLGDTALVLCRELVGGAALIATNLFVREDGDWRLLHHHSGPVSMPSPQ